jgi:hypothetical protein
MMMKKNIKSNIFVIAICLIISALSLYLSFTLNLTSFSKGVFAGFGFSILAMIIISVVNMILKLRYPEEMRKKEMLAKEERSLMIKEKAGFITSSISFATYAIVIFILSLKNIDMNIILLVWTGMMIDLVVFIVMLFYYNKKY